MKSRTHWISGFAVAAGLALSNPAAALDVVACVGGGSPQQLTDDPRTCPVDRRIDAISVAVDIKQITGSGTGGGGGVGKPVVSDFKVGKRLDGSSANLFKWSVNGQHQQTLLIVGFDRDSHGSIVRAFSILLTDVTVTLYDFSAEDTRRASGTTEIVNFGYSRLTLRDERTGQTVVFDVKTNTVS